jgi:diguanylate cyclase (GGDEF)-like protein
VRVAGPTLASRLRRLPRVLGPQLGRVEVFAELVREVNATFEPRRVGDILIGRLRGWLPLPAWAVVASEWLGQPRIVASRGLSAEAHRLARQVAVRVFRQGQDVLMSSVADSIDGAPAQAVVALALSCRGQTRAAAIGFDDRPSPAELRLTETARSLLALALEPAALALDTALRVQRAQALSVTDDLTQLYNSRFLGQVLRRETKRTARTRRPVALLFIDLDGFKDVNDTHGHLLGSRALVEVAAVLRRAARETDIIARYGGDEFAIVLPETDLAGARLVAERVRDRIAAHRFLHGEGLAVRLTASIGIAVLPDHATTAEGLLQAADRAMYWVKSRGKDGIHLAAEPAAPMPAIRAGEERVR